MFNKNITSPYETIIGNVKNEWIDFNGHLNVGFYHVAFDLGLTSFEEYIGINKKWREKTKLSTMVVESHASHWGELFKGDTILQRITILGYDKKRLHIVGELFEEKSMRLAATIENMCLFVNMETRKVAESPKDIYENIKCIAKKHASVIRPERLSRVIKIKTIQN